MALINSLCSMLRTTPFHRENYSRLILTVIGKFYQRCSDRFSHLVSVKTDLSSGDDDNSIALAAQWAQRPELGPCLTELFKLLSGNPSMAAKSQLCRQETHLENSLLGEGAVGKDDLISSTRNVSALASLYHSVVSASELNVRTELKLSQTWFAAQLNSLKMSQDEVVPPLSPLHLEPPSAITPTTPYLPTVAPFNADEPLKLPLSSAMAMFVYMSILLVASLANGLLQAFPGPAPYLCPAGRTDPIHGPH